MFKDNSRLKFLPTTVHKCDAVVRLINMPWRMCRGRELQAYRIVTVTGISLVIIT